MTQSEKIFRIAAASLFFVAVVAMFLLFQKNQKQQMQLNEFKDQLEHSSEEIEKLNEQNTSKDRDLRRKQLDIDGLNTLIADKDEEIERLIASEDSARARINELNAGIMQISDELRDMQSSDSSSQRQVIDDFMAVLNREKDAMQGEIDRYKASIHSLQEDKARAREDQALLQNQLLDLTFSRDSLQEVVWNTDSVFRQYRADVATIKEIVEHTEITLRDVVLSKKKDQRKKVRNWNERNQEKWNHTMVVFSIDHPNRDLLSGERFALRLQDLDRKSPVEIYEDNPTGGGKKRYLLEFGATNGELKKTHTNFQSKDNNNYEIQFLLIRNGQEHLLYKGKFPLVKNGKRINPKDLIAKMDRSNKKD